MTATKETFPELRGGQPRKVRTYRASDDEQSMIDRQAARYNFEDRSDFIRVVTTMYHPAGADPRGEIFAKQAAEVIDDLDRLIDALGKTPLEDVPAVMAGIDDVMERARQLRNTIHATIAE